MIAKPAGFDHTLYHLGTSQMTQVPASQKSLVRQGSHQTGLLVGWVGSAKIGQVFM